MNRRLQNLLSVVLILFIFSLFSACYKTTKISNSNTISITTITTPPTGWIKYYGGKGDEEGRSVQQTTDGGYILIGYTDSYGMGDSDVYLLKTDSNGDTLWTRTFGGAYYDRGYSGQQTDDGGYIIAGCTDTYGSSDRDVYLIKTDSNGDTLWTKTFGGINLQEGYSIQQTIDDGYIIVGHLSSFSGYSPDHDVYLIKTDNNGDSLWTRIFIVGENDYGYSVQQTDDVGYIITGTTDSSIDDSLDHDIYLIKTDNNGNTLWIKTFGESKNDYGYSVQQTIDGGYIITGYTGSYDTGSSYVYLIKTNSNGDTLWTKTFGRTNYNKSYSVQQTNDGGFIITGETANFGTSGWDIYLIKTDSNGDTLWTKTFGGNDHDYGYAVQQTFDGGYIITGYTGLYGVDGKNILLIKTDENGNLEQ